VNFKDFNFCREVEQGLESMGYKDPTPIQQAAIPKILQGKDLIGLAQTGTGKTAAFLLPVMNKIVQSEKKKLSTIIIVPTRELAVQIDQQVEGFGYFTGISSIPIYGGGDAMGWDQQKLALTEGADIIVATPGRLISHLNLGYVKVEELDFLILDEADRLLDMGFHEDINKIINYLPTDRQTLFFSATMPPKVKELANKILKDPEEVSVAVSKPAENIRQGAFLAYDNQKVPLLDHFFSTKEIPSVIVFSSTKRGAKEVEKELKKLNYKAGSIHSDLEQKEREEIIRLFKNQQIQILIATDIIARGIDIKAVSLVVNYDVPNEPEDYIHRIGRTARASESGVAITLVNEADQYKFKRIEDLLEKEIPKFPLPEILGEGPEYSPSTQKKGKFIGKGKSKNKQGKGRKPVSSSKESKK
jgi:ATP-dependent RNA helicase RhlE